MDEITEMKLIPITETEIINTITTLKRKYASGYDGVSNKILKILCTSHKQAFYLYMSFFTNYWNLSRQM
jgi:hypothetical protein